MRKSSRLKCKEKVDYCLFNSTGSKSKADVPNMEKSMEDSKELDSTEFINCLLFKFESASEDIVDFIEENTLDVAHHTIQDVDDTISKIETLKSRYGTLNIQLRSFLPDFDKKHGKQVSDNMDIIKNYIESCKDVRNLIRKSQGMTKISEEERVKRSISFQVDNVYRSIEDLHAEIQTDLKAATDAEISRRKNEIADLRKRMDNISSNVKDILSDLNDEPQVVQINKRYDKLYSEFHSYCTKIISEFDVRDIEKEKLFKESHLNIKLSKFKGHDSVDIYSFQRDFERLHLRVTPTHLLPDLLKNNFLDDPALSLVKNLDDINEIWNRLKLTYGNPKNLLERKLDELSNIQQIFRAKDPEKIIDGLSKIITVMKDLMILSKHHNIEGKLYHGNGIERIYRLLGDGRVTRWLTLSCEEELEGEQLWKRLISYLEKDMKIQQQRSLIQKIEDPKTKSSKDHKSDRKQHAHVTNQRSKVSDSYNNATTTQSTCAICGSTDHISTNGPNNSKLIQYFSCEKFVSMSPSERFKELIKKKLCFQCLFPGANHSQGKHSDGRCQRDFVCPHKMMIIHVKCTS